MDAHYGDYHSIEQRIEHAIEAMQSIDCPKITVFVHEFHISHDGLWRYIQGQQSKSTHPNTNKLLNDTQEQLVRAYLARCDKLSMLAMAL
jgi:hypothetical protein